MPNNDDQLQQQYQDILNKYASSLAPVPEEKTLIETPIETPKIEELIPPASPEIIPEPVISKPIIKEEPTVPPIYFPPEPIINKPSNFFKYLFYFSLLLFIAVISAIIYNFSSSQSTPTTTAPTPTKIISQFCELGDKKYIVGQSFASDDACNTCSCTPNLTIACTQKACLSPTPISSP